MPELGFSSPARPGLGGWFTAAVVGGLLFVVDLALLLMGVVRPDDSRIDLRIHAVLGPGTDWFFAPVSAAAEGWQRLVLALVLIGVLVWARKRVAVGFAVLAVIGAPIWSNLIKVAVRRPRPELFHHAVQAGGYSFPSGHSTDTASLCAAMVFTVACLGAARWLVALAAVVAVTVTVLVGLSRITLGVHYPSDVVGGWALGTAWAGAVFAAARRYPVAVSSK